MNINGYELVETCGACPEQYDVLRNDNIVGYLRLRHGYFSAQLFGPMGTEVYHSHPNGDGIFQCEERDFHLTMAVNAIDMALKMRKDTQDEPCDD